MMPCPRPFDGYVEQPVRVSSTSLIHFERNRYSVPTPYAHRVVSLHIYPAHLVIVADDQEVARHVRQFDRYQTIYNWEHYIPLLERKPGALRNGAPFMEMPEPLLALQRHLLRHPGGGRVMAQVLSAIPVHGIEEVLVAVEIALESGRPSGEHVLNVLGRLKNPSTPEAILVTSLNVRVEPAANVSRYETLRNIATETHHVP